MNDGLDLSPQDLLHRRRADATQCHLPLLFLHVSARVLWRRWPCPPSVPLPVPGAGHNRRVTMDHDSEIADLVRSPLGLPHARQHLDTGADGEMMLDEGTVYIDSEKSRGDRAFEVRRAVGIARDIGPRFEVRFDGSALRVRVRDGLARLREPPVARRKARGGSDGRPRRATSRARAWSRLGGGRRGCAPIRCGGTGR